MAAYMRFSLAGYANNARGRVDKLEATIAEQAKRIEMLQYIIARSIPEEKTQNILEGLVEQYGSEELKETLKVQRLRKLDVAAIIARILYGEQAEILMKKGQSDNRASSVAGAEGAEGAETRRTGGEAEERSNM